MPAEASVRIYTPEFGVQHTQYDFVTPPGQGSVNKDSGTQSSLLPYMQRCDEAAGLNKLCNHGTTTAKIIFPTPTGLAQGELQDSR